MLRWSKSGKSPAPAAGGEVAVQKVERIEMVPRPEPARRPPGRGADGDATFKRTVEDFIQKRKRWFQS